MSSNSKAIAKLKKKYNKFPWKVGSFGLKSWFLQNFPPFLILFLLRNVLVKSEYKLKRESTKFFQYSVIAYSTKKRRCCDQSLVIAFGLIDRYFDIAYVALIRNAVRSTMSNSTKRHELSDHILETTKGLNTSILDATGWYQLSRGLFFIGYFRAAWIARENSMSLSVVEGSDRSSDATAVSRAIQAHLERLELDSAKEILAKTNYLGKKALSALQEALAWFEGNGVPHLIDATVQVGASEELFYQLVKGKRVALVGPGHPRGEYGDEIDATDTVARVKFVGVKNLPPQKFHGSRCNIAYQAAVGVLAEYMGLGLKIDYYENIDLMVSSSALSQFRAIPILNIESTIPMYRTTPVSGIIILYQLIKASPKKLMVYGYDFRADRKQYSNAARDFYKDNGPLIGHPYPGFEFEDLPQWIIASDFGEHDFVSNFCFAQNLYKAGLFDIEPYGKSILELTPYQYVERLEEMLGDW